MGNSVSPLGTILLIAIILDLSAFLFVRQRRLRREKAKIRENYVQQSDFHNAPNTATI